MKSLGNFLSYYMPILLLVGPMLLLFEKTHPMFPLIGAICLGLGLFTLSIKVDLILGHLKKTEKRI